MSKPAIEIRNIGKLYSIGGLRDDDGLRHAITDWITHPINRLRQRGQKEELWALRNISLNIEEGEVLGVIGRNGAGKSTLLKVLSRITDPTEGEIVVRGRVASLLEVGTGFHPELTGRENIFLNGAILGMTRREIRNKFDDIVAFSEVERFLETPVKRYSSGMAVRLAFAIAAHLEPEILAVDEVLAVGDTAFQKKSLGKMGEVAKVGRTVLFVSHNMAAINALCSHGLLLHHGETVTSGERGPVVRKYLEAVSQSMDRTLGERKDRQGNGRMRFVEFWMENAQGKRIQTSQSGQDVTLAVRYKAAERENLTNVYVAFALNDPLGTQFTDLVNAVAGEEFQSLPAEGVIRCHVKRLPLMPGVYTANAIARVNTQTADFVLDAGKFEVEAGEFFSTGRLLHQDQGYVLIDNRWEADPA
ncbi:MAG: ABC transporter ATP-binding protein [Pseudomonadota bacterium]